MNDLTRIFNDTLVREGKNILINGMTIKVFFRKNNTSDLDTYTTLYAPLQADIRQGNTFTYNGSAYLILQALTVENEVYRKYTCVATNEIMKFELVRTNDSTKADLTTFNMFMVGELSDKLNTGGNVITISSTATFWLSLNDISKRIVVGNRFYSGCFQSPFKIIDINYKNDIVELYCERTTSTDNDDKENGIADRWRYEEKPDHYIINLTESEITLEEEKTAQLNVTVTKNGVVMNPLPSIKWVSADSTIATIDTNNVLHAIKEGIGTITGSYKGKPTDTCITDNIAVKVTKKSVVVGDIVITPLYNQADNYKIFQYEDIIFKASIIGVIANWTISLDPQGIPSSYYDSVIDNVNGTFHVTNNSMIKNKMLKYTIRENGTNKTIDYNIALGSA